MSLLPGPDFGLSYSSLSPVVHSKALLKEVQVAHLSLDCVTQHPTHVATSSQIPTEHN